MEFINGWRGGGGVIPLKMNSKIMELYLSMKNVGGSLAPPCLKCV